MLPHAEVSWLSSAFTHAHIPTQAHTHTHRCRHTYIYRHTHTHEGALLQPAVSPKDHIKPLKTAQ